MVKITLADTDYIIETLSCGKKESFHITQGMYQGKKYLQAVVSEGSIILEGEEVLLLKEKVAAVYVKQHTILERAAEFLKSESVYLEKSDAVPKGRERDLLRLLIP
jgi:hypothetical protein